MPHKANQITNAPEGVERACEITKHLFQHARGQHETDAETIDAIARQSRLSPAAIRRFIQPSRRPKDVSLSVWQRLLGAYRRYLQRELAALEAEIRTLEFLDSDDRALCAVLDQAKALVHRIEMVAAPHDDRTE
jgi:AraC-like DNA-binding protein